MFDYIVAVAVALIGLAVVYSLFTSIDSKESVVVKKAKSPTSPSKKPAEKKLTKKERQAIREEDDIIAKEIALATTGMHSDKRNAKIITLDEYRTTKKEKADLKEKSGPIQTAFTAKQVEQDKEQGFSVVKREAPKKEKVQSAEPVISQKEALDRKLGQFFRASAKKGKGKKNFLDEEPSTEGGKVVIKGTITSGRTW